MKYDSYNYVSRFIAEKLARGSFSFSLQELRSFFPERSQEAIKQALLRLSNKGEVASVHKGFYIIIPPERKLQKVLPAEFFIGELMKHLNRQYYFGLLSAASYFGASHQQPQEYYILIQQPQLRTRLINKLKINYLIKSNMPLYGLEEMKTDAGFVRVSGPELTAIDLVEYHTRIGGMGRVCELLTELAESIRKEKLEECMRNNNRISVLQRLGYILEFLLGRKDLADVISGRLNLSPFYNIRFNPSRQAVNSPLNPTWKVYENYSPEMLV